MNKRIEKLEIKERNSNGNNSSRRNPVNDQGNISNYQSKRRAGNIARTFDNRTNESNKRTAKKTEEIIISSNEDTDLNKRTKITNKTTQTTSTQKNKGKDKNSYE